MPTPTYVEDQTVQPGTEVVEKAGSAGSQWEVRLVVTKNGETVSQDVDHTVTYKGHAPVVKRNTSGVWVPAPGESLPEGTTLPGETTPSTETTVPSTDVPQGPGEGTQATQPEGPGVNLPEPGAGQEPGSSMPGPDGPGTVEIPANPGM